MIVRALRVFFVFMKMQNIIFSVGFPARFSIGFSQIPSLDGLKIKGQNYENFDCLAYRAHGWLGQPKILDLDRHNAPIHKGIHKGWRREAPPPSWMGAMWPSRSRILGCPSQPRARNAKHAKFINLNLDFFGLPAWIKELLPWQRYPPFFWFSLGQIQGRKSEGLRSLQLSLWS